MWPYLWASFHLDIQGIGEIEMFIGEGLWGRSKGWGLARGPVPLRNVGSVGLPPEIFFQNVAKH